MGPMQQRFWAYILYCLAVSALQARSATTLTGQVTFAAIQTAINGLPDTNPASPTAVDVDARTIIIQDTDGLVDFITNSLVIQKIGVTLRGAGPGPTGKVTFYSSLNTGPPVAPSPGGCAAPSEGVPMLQICRDATNQALGTPTMPIVIDNIRFENTNANYQTAGPEKGIGVSRYSGPSTAVPSRIQNCEFKNLWRSGVSGVGIEITTIGTNANWLIQNNVFDGTRQGIYLNSAINNNNGISVVNNYFTRFYTCFRMGNNDVTTGLTITGNSMIGGWSGVPGSPGVPSVIQGIAVSAVATSTSQNKNWNIQNNKIEGVNQAIELRGSSGTYSWVGVDISKNYINANAGCPPALCANVYNGPSPFPPPAMPDTWWGASPPPADKFFPNTPGSPQPNTTPWIVQWSDGTCTTGFCPTDTVINTDVVPDIISVSVNPTTVSPGQAFEIIVTLLAPVSFGTLRITSNPPGITCQIAQLSASDKVIRVPCTAPPATTAQAALAPASSPASTAAAAAAATAGDVAVGSGFKAYAASGQYNWRFNLITAAPTKRFVITAIATADRTDTMTATLLVCQNFPWPFRADTGDCSGCAYNCATGVFSCANCKCACPKKEHPYDPPADKPPYEGADREAPNHRDAETGYEDREPAGDKEAPYPHREKQPYADREPYHGSEEHREYEGRHSDDKTSYDHDADEDPSGREETREYADKEGGGYADREPEGHKDAPYEDTPYTERREPDIKEYSDRAPDSYRDTSPEEHLYDRHDADKPHHSADAEAPYDQQLYDDILADNTYKTDADSERMLVIHVPDHSADSKYAAGRDDFERRDEHEYGADRDKHRSYAGKKTSVNTVVEETVGEHEDDASAEWLSALLDSNPQPADTPAVSALFEGTPLSADLPTPGLETIPDQGASAHAAAHTASLWHPLVQDYDLRSQQQSAPLPTAAAVPQDQGCGEVSQKRCVCGPAPLTVSSGCVTVTYDPCGNTLRCTGGGYY